MPNLANIQLFDFQGNDVRTATHDDGSLWFAGVDICNALGYSNHRDALSKLDEDEKSGVAIPDPHGREQVTTLISESGMWKLVLTSRLPSADAFRQWLTREVLPSIRKTGSYSTQSGLRPMQQAHGIVSDHVAMGDLFGVPKSISLVEGAQQAMRELPVDLTPYLLNSPHMDDIPNENVFLEPTELANFLGIAVRKMNPMIASFGLQKKLSNGGWQPTEEAMSLAFAKGISGSRAAKAVIIGSGIWTKYKNA